MTSRSCSAIVAAAAVVLASAQLHAQRIAPQGTAAAATAPLPPATKLEAFKPAAGAVVTLGYDDLGHINGVSVEARELRDAKGASARGLVVEVTQNEYREDRAFVDADEIPELLKAVDALLEVKANPTSFKNFEVRYTTRGDLQVTAFNRSNGQIAYAIQAGRVAAAQVFVSADDMAKFRGMIAAAGQRLSTR